jgi:hypothetical protein
MIASGMDPAGQSLSLADLGISQDDDPHDWARRL